MYTLQSLTRAPHSCTACTERARLQDGDGGEGEGEGVWWCGAGGARSPRRASRPRSSRSSRSASPRDTDTPLCARPLSLPGESHLKLSSVKKSGVQQGERFSVLQPTLPLRRAHAGRRGEDSERLVPRREH
ncbi:hypothetical protein RR46_04004 [Papilio xuthus]|uniref:Uncharacterized protein n=1 Tax=Papilio xuthus TaxID=66420 RepID=A0A194QI27_PAPXU|nr:hypothetical protein RR46_04004 [Papilio xuthus]